MARHHLVQEAVSRIRPLSDKGPNFWTVEVPGWAISAPDKRRLKRMLRHWFAIDIEGEQHVER